jgi:hypothetical protein
MAARGAAAKALMNLCATPDGRVAVTAAVPALGRTLASVTDAEVLQHVIAAIGALADLQLFCPRVLTRWAVQGWCHACRRRARCCFRRRFPSAWSG